MNLWYVARASGMVSLLLITATVLLGVVGPLGISSSNWPRFALAGLHRNISLLTLVLVGVHAVSISSDAYVPITLVDAVIPFVSAYDGFWVGVGTVAFDLMLALMLTSFLRPWVTQRWWRAVHWSAYVCWPLALLHGLGSGTDAGTGWPLLVNIACALLVAAAAGWRGYDKWRRMVAARAPGEPQPVPLRTP